MSSPQLTVVPGRDAAGRPAAVRAAPGRPGIGPGWPLVVLFAGFPLWWVLGLSSVLPVVLAVPMAVQLARRRHVLAPPGFGLWLLFLVWVAAGLPLLWADAPGAVPGGGPSRLLVFGFWTAWYLAATVVLLWVGNLDERELPSRRLFRLLGWMFVVTTLGGLLGVLAPTLEFRSLLEHLLPRGLAGNAFVESLIHPQVAVIQDVLGFDEARPTAPFAYANSWGSNLSLFLPFFVVGWMGRDAGWRRPIAPLVLALAAVPVVYSLNRALWASLALGVVYLVVRLAVAGRFAGLLVLSLGAAVTAVAIAVSPLGGLLIDRLGTPHSNERRGQLLVQTASSTVQGSPVAGFGSTRDVQGSFFSIAGGSRPDCPACGVPPLGTQGHLWMVMFSQGLVGLALFLGFFVRQAAAFRRGRSPTQLAGMCVLMFFGLQLFVYDTLGLPLFTVMIAVAMMWRQNWREAAAATGDGGGGS
jgi:hypothetical protein